MKRAELEEPIDRLAQMIYEMQVLQEIHNKILAADVSEYSPIEEVQAVTLKAINYLSAGITTLSGELHSELKKGIEVS